MKNKNANAPVFNLELDSIYEGAIISERYFVLISMIFGVCLAKKIT